MAERAHQHSLVTQEPLTNVVSGSPAHAGFLSRRTQALNNHARDLIWVVGGRADIKATDSFMYLEQHVQIQNFT